MLEKRFAVIKSIYSLLGMKAIIPFLLILAIFCNASASTAYNEALKSSIVSLEFADAALLKCKLGKANTRQLKSLELAIKECADGIYAASAFDVSEETKNSLDIAASLLVDAAYLVNQDLVNGTLGPDTLVETENKLALLPSCFISVMNSLATESDPAGNLTVEEREALILYISQLFGDDIVGPDLLNGSTPFALTAAMIQSYLVSSM